MLSTVTDWIIILQGAPLFLGAFRVIETAGLL